MARRLQSPRTPTSIVLIVVIAVALVCASLLGGELYARHWAQSMVTAMVKCAVDDDATVSIATTPPLILQAVEDHYTAVTIETAGKQVRAAEGMKVVVVINDLRLRGGGTSGGTIGSLSATVSWTDDGIARTAQHEIPLLGGFVTGVTTDPTAGTIALEGLLGTVIAKPAVAEGGLRLQVKSFSGLGLPLPGDGMQSALDSFATEMKSELPTGLRVDEVQVTDNGVAAHFSAHNLSIPATGRETCSPGQHQPGNNE